MSNMDKYQTKESPEQDNVRTLTKQKALRNMILPERKIWAFFGGWVSCCWVPKRDGAGQGKICMPRCDALKNGYLPESKGWALYRRGSELLLSPKEGWRRMKWKLYAEVQRPEKRASSWEEWLSSLAEGEWAGVECQRGMTQDEVKTVRRGVTLEKRVSSWEEGLSSLPEGE